MAVNATKQSEHTAQMPPLNLSGRYVWQVLLEPWIPIQSNVLQHVFELREEPFRNRNYGSAKQAASRERGFRSERLRSRRGRDRRAHDAPVSVEQATRTGAVLLIEIAAASTGRHYSPSG